MKAVISLLDKDLSEHTFPMLFLGIGYALVCLIILSRAAGSAMGMGSSAGLYTALITLTPLVAFIVGNRLIVREYIGKTRLFIEALPIALATPLFIKYFLGLFYLAGLTGIALLMTMGADVDNDISVQFAGLLLLKSLTLVVVLWSLVFSISLFGRLRLILYLVIGSTVFYLMSNPAIDAEKFGPFALLDSQLFAHERDDIPWWAITQSLLFALVAAGIGFALALVKEGSLTESLAKPMNRRDLVALAVVSFSALVIFPVLSKDWKKSPYAFSGDQVIRSEQPLIAMRYDYPVQKEIAQASVTRLQQTLRAVQQELGITELPKIRISMNTSLHAQDVNMWTTDGVIIESNYADYGTYQNTVLEAHALHGVFQILTENRAVFEPRHWLVDGLTRWWSTIPLNKKEKGQHNAEVYARALVALDRSPLTPDLITNWQLVADATGLAAAEALAFTAVDYFQKTYGMTGLNALARTNLTKSVPTGLRGPLKDRMTSAQDHFAQVTGVSWETFMSDWRAWLDKQRSQAEIARYLSVIPAISGTVTSSTDANGVLSLIGRYEQDKDFGGIDPKGSCQLNHQSVGAFDSEIWLSNDNRVEGACTTQAIAHQIDSQYARGDRVYVTLGYEHPLFHWPIILHASRVTVQ